MRMVDARNGGRLINITSVHEHIPRSGASAYCASKGGLGLLTKVMAMELAEYGILVSAVALGALPVMVVRIFWVRIFLVAPEFVHESVYAQ
jgi:NAD(P)-dependent dehydrogenase (short-subunit alcohol dehydrogenase family)